ncbi:hypothetical protein [Runella salmonicolor]|uniref:Uncharacterized protein n=1 Tax=Runella salmonicolor TaxID=2950278 RepID=A0ABT1FSU2_9BACT|nr:hypothetical protein [Runella salmonicolor]MCP1384831.1 hypothetical protein [Runella salmonicolor]
MTSLKLEDIKPEKYGKLWRFTYSEKVKNVDFEYTIWGKTEKDCLEKCIKFFELKTHDLNRTNRQN